MSSVPPHTTIALPVHTAVWKNRPVGASAVLVAVQLSAPGLYLPPVFRSPTTLLSPPQTIISLPVHIAVALDGSVGPVVVHLAVQVSLLPMLLPSASK